RLAHGVAFVLGQIPQQIELFIRQVARMGDVEHHGTEELRVPAGTQTGKDFRLRGKGIAHLSTERRGDHVVHVMLDVPHPRDLSDEELDLLRNLAEHEGHAVREPGSVFDKVKNLFQ
ncbi:MAG: DnaJ C-terminal domain-containing protein, partial [Acidobacteriota bacterium]